MPARNAPTPATTRLARKTPDADAAKAPSALIDARIAELPDWRGVLLARLRSVIRSVDEAIVEEWKWNTPVWSCSGILCTGETYKKAVKLTFAKGAALEDPSKLFNSSLEGNVRRAIDYPEGVTIDEAPLKALVRAAIAVNRGPVRGKPRGSA